MEENTSFFTPARSMAVNSESEPSTLFSKYFSGTFIDSPTEMKAAKWTTAVAGLLAQRSFDRRRVPERDLAQTARLHVMPVAIGKIIDHDDVVALLQQQQNGMAADISGPAADRDALA